MTRILNYISDYLLEDRSSDLVLNRFFKLVTALAIVLFAPKIFAAKFYFGAQSIVPQYDFQEGILSYPLHLLEAYPDLMWPFIIVYAGSLIYTLNRRHWIISGLILILHMNFFNKAYLLFNSADLLLNLFFAAMFISDLTARSRNKNTYSNGLLKGLQLHICLIYLVATLYKLSGEVWLNGSAIQLIMKNDLFSNSLLVSLPSSVLMMFTYFVLVNQIVFPFAVWFKRFKPIILGSGIIIHLGTALFMGLFDFGLMMCLAYALFISQNDYIKLRSKMINLLPSKKGS